jgi:DNA helicase-2/ATP-dependent DNA helicase PcrA
MTDILDGLNEGQKQAVTMTSGPVLIVAGPGTGKTLTMSRRIARLIREGVRPDSILAVTFTNRAAREMRERTASLLGDIAGKVFIGTFHLLGLRIIQDNRAARLVLYNRDEQIALLKTLMSGSTREAQQAAEGISRIKNFLGSTDGGIQQLYDSYQSALVRQHACDFDDLIGIPITLLENADIAKTYQKRFTHIIVDEYQDINPAQYRLLSLLVRGTEISV